MRVTSARHRLVVVLLAVTGLVMVGAVPAAAGSVSIAAPRPPAHRKHVPVRPPSSPGVAKGAAIPAKPHRARAAIARPETGWTVTLTASPSTLWPTEYTTLTATANSDVGPTPYYLRIFDGTTDSYVATCAAGTTCSVAVTEPTASYQAYTAVISDASASYPPGSEQAVSSLVAVLWQAIGVSLAASPTTINSPDAAPPSTTLTATTSADVGPTPFYTEIYDVTTGTLLATCASGTTCTATYISVVVTTQRYIAYVSPYSSAFPPAGIQATSDISYVSWSAGWQLTLSGPSFTSGEGTYTATANTDVGPTPYWIEIFDETTGAELGTCAFGTSCTVSFQPSRNGDNLVAFVTTFTTGLPPDGNQFPPNGIQASSNVLSTYFQIIP